jgi:glucose-1-phosphate cytidylyltransferase
MKVVLFCGGLGMRMRDASSMVPKPMMPLGGRPLLWHLMKYYAHHGHTDFILCAGYKADVIQEYFSTVDRDAHTWVLEDGSERMEMVRGDMRGWTITIVDTGVETSISDRLAAAADYLGDDERFLLTYGDGLTDAPLQEMIDAAVASGKDASLMCARPSYTCHILGLGGAADGAPLRPVDGLSNMRNLDLWINAGFFVMRRAALDAIQPGDDFAEDTLARLAEQGRLSAYSHDGFWRGVDTMREWQAMDEMFRSGDAPWAIWEQHGAPAQQLGAVA